MRLETLVVHAGADPDPATGAVAPPVHLSTTYARDERLEPMGGHTYVRESNPTQSRLEAALAPLEGGEAALVFASGMAAAAAVFQGIEPGGHVVLPSDAYHGFAAAGREFLPRWGLTVDFTETSSMDALRRALRPETRLVLLETPSNPLLKLTDLAAAVALAQERGARVLVDNTFATPVLQRPLEAGADAVLHSTTKYFGGHSDVQGGALVFAKRDGWHDAVAHVRHVLGAVASPFNSWLVLRGMRTLAVRVRAQCAGAMAVARSLAAHPAVHAVHYPGLEGHPGHALAKRQMADYGAMLSFQVRGGEQAARRVVGRAQLFVRATSLGGTESLIEHRATSEGEASTTPRDLIRVSVGLEHPDDLVADLEQALAAG